MNTKFMNYKLILLTVFMFWGTHAFAVSPKSPHGANFKVECTTCHTTDDWNKIKPNGFNHNKTHFPLTGQHKMISCKKCHTTLEFSKAPTQCSACHTDIHQGTVGKDCERCHNTGSWIVTNVKRIHREAGFVLAGAHATADCNRCHTSASSLRFDNIRSDCYACHKDKYDATTSPNHRAAGFDTDCARCHSMVGRNWLSNGRGFDHGAFPLTGGHKLDCIACHLNNDYSKKLSTDCSTCHSLTGAQNAKYPAHATKFAAFDCSACHSIQAWDAGIKFKQHDSNFGKIYSGKHKGKWSSCTDCHTNDANYAAKCTKCHSFSTGSLP